MNESDTVVIIPFSSSCDLVLQSALHAMEMNSVITSACVLCTLLLKVVDFRAEWKQTVYLHKALLRQSHKPYDSQTEVDPVVSSLNINTHFYLPASKSSTLKKIYLLLCSRRKLPKFDENSHARSIFHASFIWELSKQHQLGGMRREGIIYNRKNNQQTFDPRGIHNTIWLCYRSFISPPIPVPTHMWELSGAN